ncbi:hypothetical protein EVAR_75131_1 [Eumeta japonica]|uniref:Uncharacterized protein n=1 Tax=Eumeta variegata TaxID=151549 RepID=A0A4C1U0U9_EUMVA|nr:hypothetical protein EVAR_75131_1 [Eumeta japonica]
MGRVIAIPKAGKDPDSQRANDQSRCCPIAMFERIALRRLLRHLTPRQSSLGSADIPPRSSWQESFTTWPPSTTGVVVPSVSFSTSRRRSTECGTRVGVQITEYANPACTRTDSSVVPGRSQFLRCSRGRNLGSTTHPRRSAQGSCLSPCLYGSTRMISPLSQVNYRLGGGRRTRAIR